jgi:flagellar protein FliS
MINQAYKQYQRTQAETASPGELILMMYNGAIKFLTAARARIESEDFEGANKNLLRAQEIVLELMISVDVGAGSVAQNLFDLYEFIHRHLVEANCRKDPKMVEEAVALLRDLLPAWEQAVIANGKARAPVGQLRYASA